MAFTVDGHVHIVPKEQKGKVNSRFGTELKEYGYQEKPGGGFNIMPPYIADSCFSADTLVHMMDVYEVDKAVILQSLMSPVGSAIAEAVAKYPDRLAGAMNVEPVDGWREHMAAWKEKGLTAVKFEMRAYTDEACYPDICYNDKRMMDIFEEAGRLDLTITIDPAPVDFPVYQPEAFLEAVSSFPEVRFVLCHLGYPRPIDTPENRDKWEKMISAATRKNCWIDISAMPDFFDAEGWPYPTALDLLAWVKERVGADKLIWGTDIPGTLQRATYPQMKEMSRRAKCLSGPELDKVMGQNAREAYKL